MIDNIEKSRLARESSNYSDFAKFEKKLVTEEISVNPDGTKNIKFIKNLKDGNISKIKKSTIFPDSWSESKIISSIKEVGDSLKE